MRMEVLLYDQAVEKFINDLETRTRARTTHALELLEKFNFELGLPHSKSLKGGLFELRVRGQQEVRLFYCYQRQNIIILYGIIKKSDRIPARVMELVKSKYKTLT